MYKAKVNGEWCGSGEKDPRVAAKDGFYIVKSDYKTGEIKAYKIIEYRDQYGRFTKRELKDADIEIVNRNIIENNGKSRTC